MENNLPATSAIPRSFEEKDQLVRSNKKPKRKINRLIFDKSPEGDLQPMVTDDPVLSANHNEIPPPTSPPHPSFRDMVRGLNPSSSPVSSFIPIEEDDEVSDDDSIPENFTEDERCPAILLSKAEKIRMRKPWKQALIIKLLDGKIGYMGLMRRLKRKWNLKGELTLTDVGCQYYIARFSNDADYQYVLTQGPWLIDDNYLTIRKWVPNFVPDEAPIKVLTAWVRIPNLAVEYFDTTFLHKIGSKIGRVLRVDKTTTQAERGQFTRLSVEIDITKPLLSKFWLKGRVWKIQYEGIKMICYNCGKMGHTASECSKEQDHVMDEMGHVIEPIHNPAFVPQGATLTKPEEQEAFGSWMLVKKPGRKRIPRPERPNVVVDPPAQGVAPIIPNPRATVSSAGKNESIPPKSQPSREINGRGSRFSVLETENEEVVATIKDPNPINIVEDISFATVDLGEDSLPQTKDNSIPVSFNLGSKSPKQSKKKSNKVISKSKSDTPVTTPNYPSFALTEIDLNIPSEPAQTHKPNFVPSSGKENLQVPPQVTPSPSSPKTVTSTPLHSLSQESFQDVTRIPDSLQCYTVGYPARENPLHQPCDGETLPLCDRPPDPCSRDKDRILAGAYLDAQGVSNDSAHSQ